MRTEDADPVWRDAQDVESFDYAGYARLLGFHGIRVDEDDRVAAALDEAFAYDGVTLIDACVSRNVPPLPPHITREYAKNVGKALLEGDPFERDVIRDSARAVATQAVERVKDALHLGHKDDE
jgi:pyruvate dehydrogenase (quinone)